MFEHVNCRDSMPTQLQTIGNGYKIRWKHVEKFLEVKVMSEHQVVVYSTPTCPWCTRAKSYLRELGIPFEEKDVSVDIAAAREMVRISGQMGVPVITIDGNVVIGFDKKRIDQLLAR